MVFYILSIANSYKQSHYKFNPKYSANCIDLKVDQYAITFKTKMNIYYFEKIVNII